MLPLFLALTLVNLLCLGVTTALGYGSVRAGGENRQMHILAGALSTLVSCGVHCIVFTYFIATAKWIQHAVMVKRLDNRLVSPTRSFRKQAFPAALLAMAAVIAAAFLGAARDNGLVTRGWHHAFGIAALAINLVVAVFEFRAIRSNSHLIDRILETIARQDQRLTPQPAQANIPPQE